MERESTSSWAFRQLFRDPRKIRTPNRARVYDTCKGRRLFSGVTPRRDSVLNFKFALFLNKIILSL